MNINLHRRSARISSVVLFVLFACSFGQGAPTYRYHVDLNRVLKDRVQVILDCRDFAADVLIFRFPRAIPGTYEYSDYGRFIKKFQAYDDNGKALPVRKLDKNSYQIPAANNLTRITYWVDDTWDEAGGFWPMAGTNIDAGRNFVINSGGFFGYFDRQELRPVELQFRKPAALIGLSALPTSTVGAEEVLFHARNYHELIDSPIMFAEPDSVNFRVRNTAVTIGADHEISRELCARQIYASAAVSMTAIGNFLDSLPADHYAYLYYFKSDPALGRLLQARNLFIPRALFYFAKNGLPVAGALEHNNSSFYYMIDPGGGSLPGILHAQPEIVIHEFMHILTPLNLHSPFIGDFNYYQPVMSKHLWLYEGITEYFTHLIRVQGGLITPKEYLLSIMLNKIQQGEKFPFAKMSLTEMSSHVLEKKYQKQFQHVYDRGAVIGMLLDLEIIRLTDGRKTLRDVIVELIARYGAERCFDEARFIDEFVALVHPDLQQFFDKYIEGREPLPYQQVFDAVGLDYQTNIQEQRPKHPRRDNDIKTNPFALLNESIITKVGKKDFVGFQPGDKLARNVYWLYYMDELGNYLPEGTQINLPVRRNEQLITLPVTIAYTKAKTPYRLTIRKDRTPQQIRYFNIWLGLDKGIANE